MTEGPRLSWPDNHHLQQGASGSHHNIRVIHLLSSGYLGFLISPNGVLVAHLSLFPYCQGREMSYQLHQTPPFTCIFRGIPFSHSFLAILTSPVPLLGRYLLARVGASISFAPHQLDHRIPTIPISFSKPHNLTHFSLSWPPRWIPENGTPQIPLWPNIIPLLLPNCKTLLIISHRLNIHSLSKVLGDLSLLSLTS